MCARPEIACMTGDMVGVRVGWKRARGGCGNSVAFGEREARAG